MAVEWQLEENNVFVIRVTGKLGIDEMGDAQSNCETAISKLGHIKFWSLQKISLAGKKQMVGKIHHFQNVMMLSSKSWRSLVMNNGEIWLISSP